MRTSWLGKYLNVSVEENGYLLTLEKMKIRFMVRPSVVCNFFLFSGLDNSPLRLVVVKFVREIVLLLFLYKHKLFVEMCPFKFMLKAWSFLSKLA